jgi:hypothetical protein
MLGLIRNLIRPYRKSLAIVLAAMLLETLMSLAKVVHNDWQDSHAPDPSDQAVLADLEHHLKNDGLPKSPRWLRKRTSRSEIARKENIWPQYISTRTLPRRPNSTSPG